MKISTAKQPKMMIHAVLLVALASMVFVYPFDNHFRFTLGVAVLSTLLLSLPEFPPVRFVITCGVAIVAFRATMAFLLGHSSLEASIALQLPAFAYYLTFAVLFKLFDIRNRIANFPVVILLLSVTDVVSNSVELLFQPALKVVSYELVLASIILIALVRSIISVYGYVLLRHYHSFVLVQEQLKRYSELVLMIAKLRTELFYLKKSSQDIENVMERSYWLYNQLRQQEEKDGQLLQNAGKALEIARNIHEVKKDYFRVIAGIENVLKPSSPSQSMRFSEVFHIIEQNILRYIESSGKRIEISFQYADDFLTDRHFTIVSLFDNLIMNAVEACGEAGTICVFQEQDEENIILRVTDDGVGIKSEELPLIFEPGYSTKFSPVTGKMSTGLGLAHVDILTKSLGGQITVSSQVGQGATVMISIPRETIVLPEATA